MWIRIGYVHGDNSLVVCNQDTGYHCNSILRVKLRTMHAIVHGIVRYCMVLHGVSWCCMVLDGMYCTGVVWYWMVCMVRLLYGIVVWYVGMFVLSCIALYA